MAVPRPGMRAGCGRAPSVVAVRYMSLLLGGVSVVPRPCSRLGDGLPPRGRRRTDSVRGPDSGGVVSFPTGITRAQPRVRPSWWGPKSGFSLPVPFQLLHHIRLPFPNRAHVFSHPARLSPAPSPRFAKSFHLSAAALLECTDRKSVV